MDDIDRKILSLLAADARRALSDIGAEVGLSPSAVNERIRRMTARGVIRRFTVEVDPAAMGLPVPVFLWVALREDADEGAFRAFASAHPAIAECHHVTGAWSYLLKLHLPDLAAIEPLLEQIKAQRFLARSETILALSSPVPAPMLPR
ncbi:Lrp/AsnC family transcriptional regulator [Pseudooceanicola sp. 200-1SW]|uniref:Lrp/AsnC family transcriptional regulator n=1 Tax=Pseudooceanicola sp. 200-1SW TaxID=3425949 RepID=UPI003D7FDC98